MQVWKIKYQDRWKQAPGDDGREYAPEKKKTTTWDTDYGCRYPQDQEVLAKNAEAQGLLTLHSRFLEGVEGVGGGTEITG